MHQKVFGKVTAKREQTIKKESKQEIGHSFFDRLFILRPSWLISIYVRKKMDRPQNWLGMIGWKAFLAEEVNVTLLLRLHWDTCIQKSHTQRFYCNVTGSFKIINEHHSGHLYSKIYKTLKNIDICLAGGFCPCPHPPFLYSFICGFS